MPKMRAHRLQQAESALLGLQVGPPASSPLSSLASFPSGSAKHQRAPSAPPVMPAPLSCAGRRDLGTLCHANASNVRRSPPGGRRMSRRAGRTSTAEASPRLGARSPVRPPGVQEDKPPSTAGRPVARFVRSPHPPSAVRAAARAAESPGARRSRDSAARVPGRPIRLTLPLGAARARWASPVPRRRTSEWGARSRGSRPRSGRGRG